MEIQLGSLTFVSAKENLQLLASPVAVAIEALEGSDAIDVSEIDPTLSDTAGFCEHYGITLEQSANCVIVEGKRGEERQMAACIILASTRADVNGKVREFLSARKVSFAQMEKAVSESGMEFGAITPIGLPASWPILIDAAVTRVEHAVIGSGIRTSKLTVPGSFLATLPNATVIENLANPKTDLEVK